MLPQLQQKFRRVPGLQSLAKLAWTDGGAFDCQGRRIGIRSNDPALLPPSAAPDRRGGFLLYRDAVRVMRSTDAGAVLDAFAARQPRNARGAGALGISVVAPYAA